MVDKNGVGIEYNKNLIKLAQHKRKNMTKEECHLWYDFLSLLPIRFKRQVVIRNYIVDFYCDKARIIIELDGTQHYADEKQIEKDKNRDKELTKLGFTVLRYSNYDINRNFGSVCDDIYNKINFPEES